jgi:hypothetical protein
MENERELCHECGSVITGEGKFENDGPGEPICEGCYDVLKNIRDEKFGAHPPEVFGPVYQHGYISIEQSIERRMFKGDIGIQMAEDGRVWVCVNGLSVIRFTPIKERGNKND